MRQIVGKFLFVLLMLIVKLTQVRPEQLKNAIDNVFQLAKVDLSISLSMLLVFVIVEVKRN